MTLAEGTGFEPAGAYTPSVLETDAIDHSATPPSRPSPVLW